MATEHTLPGETFADDVLAVWPRDDDAGRLRYSIDVTPAWLEQVLAGEITELPVLTVLGICRKLKVMPEDMWDPELVARAFSSSGVAPSWTMRTDRPQSRSTIRSPSATSTPMVRVRIGRQTRTSP